MTNEFFNQHNLPDLIDRIKRLEQPSQAIDGEIACLINFKVSNFTSVRNLRPRNSFEDIASYGGGVPKFTAETSAAEILVGPREFPFVYTAMTDFGGLCRAKVSNAMEIQTQADGCTVAAALCAAALEAQYKLWISQLPEG